MEEVAATVLAGARRVQAPTLLVRGAMSDVVADETIQDFLQPSRMRKWSMFPRPNT